MGTKRRSRERAIYRSAWFWIVVGVAALALMLALTGVLCQPPPAPPARALLDTRHEDLVVFTRMIDTVALEPNFYTNTEEAAIAESLLNSGSVQNAFQRLDRSRRKAQSKNRLSTTAFAGLLRSRLREHSLATQEFQDALSLTDSSTALLAARLCFNIGYLFQRFGQPESARRYYSQSLRLLRFDDTVLTLPDPPAPFLPGLLNNLGVASEILGDTSSALSLYLKAATFLDTTSTHRDAQRLRENIARLRNSHQR